MHRMDDELHARARGLLQQAMAHDPFYGPAYSYAAFWYIFHIGEGRSTDFEADAREAVRLAETAVGLDENDPRALAFYGHVQAFLVRDFDRAMLFLDRAIEAGPSTAMAWTMNGATCGYIGNGTAGGRAGGARRPSRATGPLSFLARGTAGSGALRQRQFRRGGGLGAQGGGTQWSGGVQPAYPGRESDGARQDRRGRWRGRPSASRAADVPTGPLREALSVPGRGACHLDRPAARRRAAGVTRFPGK